MIIYKELVAAKAYFLLYNPYSFIPLKITIIPYTTTTGKTLKYHQGKP